MTKDNLITVPVGTTLEDAEKILHEHRVEKLLVVDDKYNLKGLITVKDIQKKLKYPNAAKDEHGRLRVGAAIGATGDFLERAQEMVKAKVDVLAIDSAHGHTSRVIEAVKTIKAKLPEVDLLAGNVGTHEGACALAKAGADAIKVGIGPGSICTTRIVTGAGVPQITAIAEAARACRDASIPVIADGGIKYLRRHQQSHCRRRQRGDDRFTVCRHGRESRRNHSVSGPVFQVVSRHGLAFRHGRRIERALRPEPRRFFHGQHGHARWRSRRQPRGQAGAGRY